MREAGWVVASYSYLLVTLPSSCLLVQWKEISAKSYNKPTKSVNMLYVFINFPPPVFV